MAVTCSVIIHYTLIGKIIVMFQWSFLSLRKDLWVNIRIKGAGKGIEKKYTIENDYYITESRCPRFNTTNKFAINVLA